MSSTVSAPDVHGAIGLTAEARPTGVPLRIERQEYWYEEAFKDVVSCLMRALEKGDLREALALAQRNPELLTEKYPLNRIGGCIVGMAEKGFGSAVASALVELSPSNKTELFKELVLTLAAADGIDSMWSVGDDRFGTIDSLTSVFGMSTVTEFAFLRLAQLCALKKGDAGLAKEIAANYPDVNYVMTLMNGRLEKLACAKSDLDHRVAQAETARSNAIYMSGDAALDDALAERARVSCSIVNLLRAKDAIIHLETVLQV